MIKNIVFDFGGVLLTEDDNWLYFDETKNLLEVDDEQLEKAWNFAWPDARSGTIDEAEFFKKFLQSLFGNYNSDLVLKLKSIYRKHAGKLNTFKLLPELKRNYKLLALTNAAKDWLQFKTDKFSLEKYFDLIISSCNEGVAKPSKEIFLILIEKGKIDPKETVFVDNWEKNIKPAQELGFKTILFKDKEQMIKEMRELGVKI
jgi:epoxide hydrolase-like predicted phosphatase